MWICRSAQHDSQIDLSIIIVNWNSVSFLEKCLASIRDNSTGVSFEIVVVDNASYDGCKEMLEAKFPDVIFVQSNTNMGFAKANNAGAAISTGRHLLFLNPDTEIIGSAIYTMLRGLESLHQAGIVGCKLLNTDLTVQSTSIRVFPNILNQTLDAALLMRFFPRMRLWGTAPLHSLSDSPHQVNAISGACQMIKRSVFESIDGYSIDYFMYSEDIDLCYKALKAGWKTYYIPNASIIHHGGQSSSKNVVSTFSAVMMAESRFCFFRKTRSIWYSRWYRVFILLVSVIRITIILFIFPIQCLRGRTVCSQTSLKKWFAIMRWTLGLEKWAQNYSG